MGFEECVKRVKYLLGAIRHVGNGRLGLLLVRDNVRRDYKAGRSSGVTFNAGSGNTLSLIMPHT